MNILVVCHYGLYENLSFSFVHNQIREFIKIGHNVRVICPIGFGKKGRNGKRLSLSTEPLIVDGVEIYDIRYITLSSYGEKKFNANSAIAFIKLSKRVFHNYSPDIVFAHTLGFDSRIGAWLKKKFGCPLIVTTHGSDTEIPLNSGKTEHFRKACNQADAIVAVSSKLSDKVRSCGTITPVYTVTNGYVPHKNSKEISKIPLKIIQAGNLIPLKKVNITIRALKLLKAKYPEMKLTVVGQGPEKEALLELCKKLDLCDSVTFTGQLNNNELFEKLCAATYFVMVSKPEGFGIVYLEAMAAGCIAIGTKGEGIADVIKHGENGFLVEADSPDEIANTIEFCINSPNTAAEIAANGKETAKNLTWANNAQKYIVLFQDLRK